LTRYAVAKRWLLPEAVMVERANRRAAIALVESAVGLFKKCGRQRLLSAMCRCDRRQWLSRSRAGAVAVVRQVHEVRSYYAKWRAPAWPLDEAVCSDRRHRLIHSAAGATSAKLRNVRGNHRVLGRGDYGSQWRLDVLRARLLSLALAVSDRDQVRAYHCVMRAPAEIVDRGCSTLWPTRCGSLVPRRGARVGATMEKCPPFT